MLVYLMLYISLPVNSEFLVFLLYHGLELCRKILLDVGLPVKLHLGLSDFLYLIEITWLELIFIDLVPLFPILFQHISYESPLLILVYGRKQLIFVFFKVELGVF